MQSSAAKSLILTFMWIPFDTKHMPQTPLKTKHNPMAPAYPDDSASPNSTMETKEQRNVTKSFRWPK